MCGLVVKNNDTDYTVDDEVALAKSGWSLLKTVQRVNFEEEEEEEEEEEKEEEVIR